MENNYLTALASLKSKIEIIISRYENLLSEHRALLSKYEDCQEKLLQTTNHIKELEEKINNMQLTEAFTSSATDVKEARAKINKLIREIDKCIELLNE
ncbi:MAG: hypothetical protein HUJ89_04210 [Bacteroidales bacterium]|nr:hypothetical protein [Bacteroidales bacterium]